MCTEVYLIDPCFMDSLIFTADYDATLDRFGPSQINDMQNGTMNLEHVISQ